MRAEPGKVAERGAKFGMGFEANAGCVPVRLEGTRGGGRSVQPDGRAAGESVFVGFEGYFAKARSQDENAADSIIKLM